MQKLVKAAISALPAIEQLTNDNSKAVKAARLNVTEALALDAQATIKGIEKLEAAEAKMKAIYQPDFFI